MPQANGSVTDFMHHILPMFPIMLPQTANALSQNNPYFNYVTALLTEVFITPMQKRTYQFEDFWHMLREFEYWQNLNDHRYITIVTKLQLRILLGIYFLQISWDDYGIQQIKYACDLVSKYNQRFNCELHGEFRMAHLGLLSVCMEYKIKFSYALAPWEAMDDILKNGLAKCLAHLTPDLIQSTNQCMRMLIMMQRQTKFRENIKCALRHNQLSIVDIRDQLYNELKRAKKAAAFPYGNPGNLVKNSSKLSQMEAELGFLRFLFDILFDEDLLSVDVPEEISKIGDFLRKATRYVTCNQSSPFPDRMQNFRRECEYLTCLLRTFSIVGPLKFLNITYRQHFDLAVMVYKNTAFFNSIESRDIAGRWNTICCQYNTPGLLCGGMCHMTALHHLVNFHATDSSLSSDQLYLEN